MYIKNYCNSERECCGFFGTVDHAKIINLNIQGNIIDENNGKGYFIGGILGFGNCGIVSNCNSSVNIILKNCISTYVGGVIGWLKDWCVCEINTEIINCNNFGKIEVNGGGFLAIGGIAGMAQESVQNCNNYSDVSCCITINTEKLYLEFGGIIGENCSSFEDDDMFENNLNYGSLILQQNLSDNIIIDSIFVGGLIGYSSTSDNYNKDINKGNIEIKNIKGIPYANNSDGLVIGGLIGLDDDYENESKGLLKNSYNVGSIILSNINIDKSFTMNSVGGIIGGTSFGARISNLYTTNNIDINNSQGIKYLGGIIGKNDGSNIASKINSSYYAGNMTINNSTIEACGGVVGINTLLGQVENCYFVKNEKVNSQFEMVGIEENKLISCGIKESDNEIFSIDFLTNVLGWEQSIWNITGNNHPEFY